VNWGILFKILVLIKLKHYMEEDIKNRLDNQDKILEKIYKSTEKTRKYFLWTLIVTLIMFFIPLIGLLFILPGFISIYTSTLGGF